MKEKKKSVIEWVSGVPKGPNTEITGIEYGFVRDKMYYQLIWSSEFISLLEWTPDKNVCLGNFRNLKAAKAFADDHYLEYAPID